MNRNPRKHLLVSILSLGRPQNVLKQLETLPGWLSTFGASHDILCHIVIRNNDPGVDFATVAARLTEIEHDVPGVTGRLVTGGANLGFGRGHNENCWLVASDYLLILNDDIGFPDFAWLDNAVSSLQADAATACVGALENPQFLNPTFGNGLFPDQFHVEALRYAEGSILLFDTAIFKSLGMFNEAMVWAMCEDADLSLRAQQMGYNIKWISMPHQHWRSTSFNALPAPVRSSILEHNRATLFATWRDAIATGQIGRFEVFDLWSDGIGDVFCSLPHVLAELARYTPKRRQHVVINTSHPALFDIFCPEGVRVVSFKDIDDLRRHLGAGGISNMRTMRDVNFSLPLNIHALLAGTLAVPLADAADKAKFALALRGVRRPNAPRLNNYCVIHVEFNRTHEGRALSPASVRNLVREAARKHETLVVVGSERRLAPDICEGIRTNFVDLQGQLSVGELIGVIAGAVAFAGIDSFPAHVAQAACVPSAVFFGAVHPLSRTWDESRLWPIVAALDCIGCYHTHLEPSVPFCMRRDQLCTTQAADRGLDDVLASMSSGVPYDWRFLRDRFGALQAKLVQFMRHHPAPPERLVRPPSTGNEQISTLIYRMTAQMSDLLRSQYQTASIKNLTNQVRHLQSEVFSRDIRLESLQVASIAAPPAPPAASYSEIATDTIELCSLAFEPVRCKVRIMEQWLQIDAWGSDPQLLLPPLTSRGGDIRLRLSCDAAANETLQVLWQIDGEGYGEDRMESLQVSPTISHIDVVCAVDARSILQFRIDPSTEAMRTRLRGSLAGDFTTIIPQPKSLPAVSPNVSIDPPPPTQVTEPVEAPVADRRSKRALPSAMQAA